MIDEKLFKRFTIYIVLAILLGLVLYLLWPTAASIFIGLVLAYVFYPIYRKIFSIVREKNTSAVILIILVMLLIIIPLWFLFPIFIRQAFNFYLLLQKIDIMPFLNSFFPSLSDVSTTFGLTFAKFQTTAISTVLSYGSDIILNLPKILLKLVIVLFVFFFGLRDGELFLNYIKSLSPFSKSAEEEFEKKFDQVTKSVIYGHFVVGAIQGILTGIGLYIFGMPHALILTVVAIFGAIIPVLGAWLAWIPSSIYLIATGHQLQGIGLALYGIIFISWVDNILRSYIVSKRAKISSGIVLIGMISGLIVFGVLGLLIGPLIIAYLLLILDAYRNKKFPALFS